MFLSNILTQKYKTLGNGNYGLVISPAVNISSFWEQVFKNTSNEIGKIYKICNGKSYIEEVLYEYNILKYIMQIENYNTFTVSMNSVCCFKLIDYIKDEYILEKLNYDKEINKDIVVYQISFDYGGKSINKITNSMSFIDSINMLIKFYKGIKTLHDNNIIHRDIKPTNVLYDPIQKKLNIIDFGLYCFTDEVYNLEISDYLLKDMYMYHPPEFYLYYYLKSKNIKQFNHQFDKEYKNVFLNPSIKLHEYYNKHFHEYNKNQDEYNIDQYIEGFKSIYNSIKNLEYVDINDVFNNEEFIYKCDIYSSYYILIKIKKLIKFENDEQKQLYNNLINNVKCFDPFKRFSCKQVITFLEFML